MSEVIFTPITPQRFSSELERLAWPIWNDRWQVKMRYQDTLDDDELRTFGFKTSGDDYFDHCHRVEMVQVFHTIAEIVIKSEKKIKIDLVDEAASLPMFKILTAYLRYWHGELERGINVRQAPIKDLILMDKLASELFVYASQYMQTEHVQTGFGALAASGGFGRSSFLKRASGPGRLEQKMPTYDSFEAYFMRKAL